MEPAIALTVGKALYAKLSAFQETNGSLLREVRQAWAHGNLERVVLDFGAGVLIVDAEAHDDSINFRCEEANCSTDAQLGTSGGFWQDFIGRTFGWGWITVNQQGYCDGLLLSFDGIEPQVSMSVVASSIKLRRIT